MSAALINRSLTNVRTELEFLYDSEVIDKQLYETLMESLPKKYAKDMAPWGVEKVPVKGGANRDEKSTNNGGQIAADAATESIVDSMKKTSLRDQLTPPPNPPAAVPVPERVSAPALGYCKAAFNYESGESGDLNLAKGDLLAVVEHLSPDWWKGYKKGSSAAQAGVFPSNYVTVISDTEFYAASEKQNEKASYEPIGSPVNAPPMYQQAQNSGYQQGYQPQPSYGGYAQFPPPSTSYYGQNQAQPQQVQAQPQQQEASHASGVGGQHFKKFGSKLGNAAIFGAGATIGSDIVNLIF